MKTPRLTPACLVICLTVILCNLGYLSPAVAQENLIINSDFEKDDGTWGMFVPGESKEKGCEFIYSKESPHEGLSCLEMKSSDLARFSVGPKQLAKKLKIGERYRLTFWIRAGENTKSRSNEAFIVRLFIRDVDNQNIAGNQALFIGLNGHTTIQSPEAGLNLSQLSTGLPSKEWTKVESVFEVPGNESTGAARLNIPEFFAQYISGSIFLDDISLVQVDKSTPLSPSHEKAQ
ncbi:MAG: hypothetical protein LBH01_00105 [Verrucomicrobiales bacterium]|nr:hypothetical protein [Verrucomicrobiales bacterium]